MKCRYFVLMAFLLTLSGMVSAQQQDTSFKPDATIRNAVRVDPLTFGMSLQIPLGSYPGRAGASLPLFISYSSKSLWKIEWDFELEHDQGSILNVYTGKFAADPMHPSASGWTSSLIPPKVVENFGCYESTGVEVSPDNYTVGSIPRMRVEMPDGSSHELRKDDVYRQNWINRQPDPAFYYSGSYYSVDGSKMRYEPISSTSGTLYIGDGSRYIYSAASIQYIDPSGNTLSYDQSTKVWTDTMGRTFGQILPTGTPTVGDVEYHLPGIGSQQLTYIFRWRHLVDPQTGASILTNPQDPLAHIGRDCSYLPPHPPDPNWTILFYTDSANRFICGGSEFSINDLHNPVLLSEIELPDHQIYRFTYNQYGEIDKVWYPTGGYETFSYGPVAPISYYENPYGITNRGVNEHRISSDGTPATESVWHYGRSTGSSNSYVTNETAPDGTVTTRSVFANYLAYVPFGMEDARIGKTFDESVKAADETVLRRTLTDWAQDSPSPSPSPSPGGVNSARRNARPVKQISIQFESGSSTALASMTETVYDTSGSTDPAYFSMLNPKQVKTYNYVSVPASTAATATLAVAEGWFSAGDVARTVENTYLYDANYKERNINSLVTETIVKDAGDTPRAKTQISYDDGDHIIINGGAMPMGAASSWINPITELGSTEGVLRGLPTKVKAYYDVSNSNGYVQTDTFYDQYGNKLISRDGRGNDTTTVFSATYAFAYPTSVTSATPDPSGTHGSNAPFTTSTTYNYTTGLPLTVTDLNGQTTSMDYTDPATNAPDPLLRIHKVTAPNGQQTVTEYGVPVGGQLSADQRFVRTKTQIDAYRWTQATSFYDGLGRTSFLDKQDTEDPDGDIYSLTCYDSMSRVSKASSPFRGYSNQTCSSSGLEWTVPEYDDLSRTKKVTMPQPSPTGTPGEVLTTYGISGSTAPFGITKTITDQAGKRRTGITDALGNMVRVIEDPTGFNHATDYQFDVLGNLRKTTQGGQTRFFMYDALGRVLYAKQVEQTGNEAFSGATDPITGNSQWSVKYTYDGNSNIATTTDARNYTITATYDALNRIIVRDFTESSMPDVNFYYDGTGLGGIPANSNGKASKVSSGVSESRYTTFDNMGRVLASEQRTTPEQLNGTQSPYGFQYTYNLSGALMEETYPSGRVVRNTVNSNGELEQVQSRKSSTAGYWTYAGSFSYNAAGAVTKMQLGNGHWETAAYNERQQVKQIGLGTLDSGQDLLKLDFEYEGPNPSSTPDKNNGSLRKQTITVPAVSGTPGFTAVQVYDYDGLNRINSSTENIDNNPTPSWKQTFIYDRYGNRTFDPAHTTTLGNCVPAVCNPSISTLNDNRLDPNSYSYDADGSVTQDAQGKRYAYDSESRQTSFFASDNTTGTPTMNYLYDGEGKRVKTTTATGGATIYVYDAGGELSAEYSVADNAIATVQAPRVSYMTDDHLGSPRIVTDANGAVVSRKDFAAFGEETITPQRDPAHGYNEPDIRQDYTGYLKDDESGLEYAQARYYNPQHGRFTSADPLTASAEPLDPQSWNRYAYCLNNPLTFMDSTGLAVNLIDKTKDKKGEEKYLGDLNKRKDKKFDISVDSKGRLNIVDSKGNQLNKNDQKALGKTLTNGEKELFTAITDQYHQATVVLDQNNADVDFGSNDSTGQNTIDLSDQNVLDQPSNKSGFTSSQSVSHETLEAYFNALGLSPEDAHKKANKSFAGLSSPIAAQPEWADPKTKQDVVGGHILQEIQDGSGRRIVVDKAFLKPYPAKVLQNTTPGPVPGHIVGAH